MHFIRVTMYLATKYYTEETIFTSSTRDGAVIFCGHASHTRRANAAPIFLNNLF